MIDQARRSYEGIVRELTTLGATDIELVRRAKHWGVQFKANGATGLVTFTATKTDRRGQKNHFRAARRAYRRAIETQLPHGDLRSAS